jgi:hypothetical protein
MSSSWHSPSELPPMTVFAFLLDRLFGMTASGRKGRAVPDGM